MMQTRPGSVVDWQGKRVLITGHTGFTGSWLSLWLHRAGASVTGYALDPPTDPSLFGLCRLDELVDSRIGDIRDAEQVSATVSSCEPEVVIHLAAQPLVRHSYVDPLSTYAVNVMGTANLLEAVRRHPCARAVVIVTTDKCYENRETDKPYGEDDPMGGHDPYSSSKACAELVTSSYRRSFFPAESYSDHGVAVASARAGNIIGGGDWAADRLVPDCIRAIMDGKPVVVRNPASTRPWQHVLDPVSAYVELAGHLLRGGPEYAEGWNIGPALESTQPVEQVVRLICEKWGPGAEYEIRPDGGPHEAGRLVLDCSKAAARLGWTPGWGLEQSISETVSWVRGYRDGQDCRNLCLQQINEHPRSG